MCVEIRIDDLYLTARNFPGSQVSGVVIYKVLEVIDEPRIKSWLPDRTKLKVQQLVGPGNKGTGAYFPNRSVSYIENYQYGIVITDEGKIAGSNLDTVISERENNGTI